MKSERQTGMFQFPGMMPTNMMMFPGYMTDNNIDTRITNLEKRVKTVENRLQRLENPYGVQNTPNYQDTQNSNQSQTCPYQNTQNYNGYNGDMYMM